MQKVFKQLKFPIYCYCFILFIFVVALSFQIYTSLGAALISSLLGVLLFSTYFFFSYKTIRLDHVHLLVKSRWQKLECKLSEIQSMSFYPSFSGNNKYRITLDNGSVLKLPLMNDYEDFEKAIVKIAHLEFERETLSNRIQNPFVWMGPKFRNWKKIRK